MKLFVHSLRQRISAINPSGLLANILLGFILVIYAYAIYTIVVTLGTFPFGKIPRNSLLPSADQWLLNLITLLILSFTFVPISRWLQGHINDLVYAQQDNLYAILALINQQLRPMQNRQLTLPQVVETISTKLHLPYVALVVDNASDRPFTFGTKQAQVAIVEYPIRHLDRPLATLLVSNRARNRPLTDIDDAILRECAQQIGIALTVADLTADLQASRERLVITREEERRRIRNDLHDGLAPSLSSFQLQLNAIRTFMQQNPSEAEKLIMELGEDMRQATAEIRRLVYDLRPPLLDDLGLVAAIKHIRLPGSSLYVEVTAPEPMPSLPAAAEVAVYRIASEAIHNVVKHAQATCCMVVIAVEANMLVLHVSDDGRSLAGSHTGGIGIQSMQERAAELGGALSIHVEENGGTRVEVRLPLEMA
jgi:two-component system NarL family sensor kinase